MAKMNKWELEKSDLVRRRMGKTGEELAELSKVVNRIQIQGIDGIDPDSGKTNRQCLIDETADVRAQLFTNIYALKLPRREIDAREDRKVEQMAEWESLYGRTKIEGPVAGKYDEMFPDQQFIGLPLGDYQRLLEVLTLLFEHCQLYHPEVKSNNVGEAVRAVLATAKVQN